MVGGFVFYFKMLALIKKLFLIITHKRRDSKWFSPIVRFSFENYSVAGGFIRWHNISFIFIVEFPQIEFSQKQLFFSSDVLKHPQN